MTYTTCVQVPVERGEQARGRRRQVEGYDTGRRYNRGSSWGGPDGQGTARSIQDIDLGSSNAPEQKESNSS